MVGSGTYIFLFQVLMGIGMSILFISKAGEYLLMDLVKGYGTVNSKLSYCNLYACVTVINTSMFLLPAIILIIETLT